MAEYQVVASGSYVTYEAPLTKDAGRDALDRLRELGKRSQPPNSA